MQHPRRKASPLHMARTLLWALLGVRKGSEYQRDIDSITPLQVVVAGVVALVLLVAGLIAIVHWIV